MVFTDPRPGAQAPAPTRESYAFDRGLATIHAAWHGRDYRKLPAISPFLFADDSRLREAASECATALLHTMSISQIGWLDDQVRRFNSDYGYSGPPLRADRLRPMLTTPVQRCLATCLPNGYVREVAIRALDDVNTPGPMALAFLMVRLNDWVEPIRELARAIVESLLVPSLASDWVSLLPVVRVLQARGRSDHSWLAAGVRRFLSEPEMWPVLVNGLRADDQIIRREAGKLALASLNPGRGTFLNEALASTDPIIRHAAVKSIRGTRRRDELDRALAVVRHDRFMPVRRELLYAVAEFAPDLARAHLRECLLDAHASIRHAARVYLRDLEAVDFQAVYAAAVGGPSVRAAIAGLGETGHAERAELIRPFLKSGSARITATAVRAIGTLLGDAATPEILPLVADDRPMVSREAARYFWERSSFADPAFLRFMLDESRPAHVRRIALQLLAKRDRTECLPELLGALKDPILGKIALEALNDWRVPRYASPPAELLQQVRAVYERAGDSVPVHAGRRVRDFLKLFQG